MIDRPISRQLDLLVRAANALEPSRLPSSIRAEVTSLLKLLMAARIAADVVPAREAADE